MLPAPNAPVRKPSSDSSTAHGTRTILRARAVLPVSRPAIADGAVVLSGNRIESAGPWRDVSPPDRADAVDLGDVALLPGLVNAHCHLDYTAMAGQLAPPATFTDWIKLITAAKGEWLYTDFAESWLDGARMLLRNGVTTVGDIEMVPELLPEVWSATPLRVFSFFEMTGVRSRRDPRDILHESLQKILSLPQGRCFGGLSPHAPYSTTPELLRLSAEAARHHDLRVVIHVAESSEEFEMFTRGRGGMFDWLARNQRDMTDCALGSPVQHLERHGALNDRLLAIHVNYLAPGDAALLAKHKVNVVHCPRSRAYFQHAPFPLAELTAAGVNICLGTDSLASVYKQRKQTVELSLFDEMREMSAAFPDLPPKTILQIATVNGARALGMTGQIGELSPGAFGDLIAVPFAGKISESPQAIVQHRGPVSGSMIDCKWAVGP